MRSYYDPTPEEWLMKEVGEKIMDLAVTEKDHAKANMMSIVGRDLSDAGTPFCRRFNKFSAEEQALVLECTEKLGITKGGVIVQAR